jgi:hypothetical protein
MASVNWSGLFRSKKESSAKKAVYVVAFFIVLGFAATYLTPGVTDTPNICDSYPQSSGISCNQAVASATERFPGEVLSVSKTTGEMLNINAMEGKSLWLLSLELSEPVEYFNGGSPITGEIELLVDSNTGKVNLYQYTQVV